MPASIYILFFSSLTTTVGWTFLRDQKEESYSNRFSIVGILLTVIFTYISLGISIYKLACHEKELMEKGLFTDPWIIRVLVHNSLAAHATWATILLFYNIAVVLRVEANIESNVACYITFGLMALFVIIFFVSDIMLIFRMQCIFVLPYIVLMVAECGTLLKNTSADKLEENLHLILAGGLMGIVFILFLVKFSLFIIKMRRIAAKKRQADLIRPTPEEESRPPSPILFPTRQTQIT